MKLHIEHVEDFSWSMEVTVDREESATLYRVDPKSFISVARSGDIKAIAKVVDPHGARINIITKELETWDGVMWSRVNYSTWFWFDYDEMMRFVTYILLKYGEE